MSYATTMEGTNIDVKIPLSEIKWLTENFEEGVSLSKEEVNLVMSWEEDNALINGKLEGNEIILNKEQRGTFKNSSDGGLALILEKFNGSGEIREVGEDGETNFVKYENGQEKKGKVVFE